jgi:hypothetical protein
MPGFFKVKESYLNFTAIIWRITMPWSVPEDDKEKEALERAKELLNKLREKYGKKDSGK